MSTVLSLTGVRLPESETALTALGQALHALAGKSDAALEVVQRAARLVQSNNDGPSVAAFSSYQARPDSTAGELGQFNADLLGATRAVFDAAQIVAAARETMQAVATAADQQLHALLASGRLGTPMMLSALVRNTKAQLLTIDSQAGAQASAALAAVQFTLPQKGGGGSADDINPVDGYRVGPPMKPDIAWDDDFPYDTEKATLNDHLEWARWGSILAGARVLRRDLAQAMDMYAHYRGGSGEPMVFDYEAGVREDANIALNVEAEITRAAAAVDEMAASGATNFQITGEAHPHHWYPETENWQKTIGGYQQWSSADVSVKDGQVTMKITVTAEDHYNFNKGASDIASDAPDDVNGRFQAVGWAKGFDSSGSVTREITWELGSPPPTYKIEPQEEEGR